MCVKNQCHLRFFYNNRRFFSEKDGETTSCYMLWNVSDKTPHMLFCQTQVIYSISVIHTKYLAKHIQAQATTYRHSLNYKDKLWHTIFTHLHTHIVFLSVSMIFKEGKDSLCSLMFVSVYWSIRTNLCGKEREKRKQSHQQIHGLISQSSQTELYTQHIIRLHNIIMIDHDRYTTVRMFGVLMFLKEESYVHQGYNNTVTL